MAGNRSSGRSSGSRAYSSVRDKNNRPEKQRNRAAGKRGQMGGNQAPVDYLVTMLKYVMMVILIMVFVRLSGAAYDIGYNIFYQKAVDPKGQGVNVTVEIKEGMSVAEVGRILKSNGLIRNADVFPYQERFSSSHGKMMPGTYTLSTDMTPEEMMVVMAQDHVAAEDGSNTGIGTQGEGMQAVDKDSLLEMLGLPAGEDDEP